MVPYITLKNHGKGGTALAFAKRSAGTKEAAVIARMVPPNHFPHP